MIFTQNIRIKSRLNKVSKYAWEAEGEIYLTTPCYSMQTQLRNFKTFGFSKLQKSSRVSTR